MSAKDVVLELVSRQNGGWAPTFHLVPDATMRRIFSDNFIRRWCAALLTGDGIGFNGDPITGYMCVSHIRIVASSEISRDDKTIVEVILDVVSTEFPDIITQKNEFDVVFENNRWCIDDIVYINENMKSSSSLHRQSMLGLLENLLIGRPEDEETDTTTSGIDANILASRRDDGPDKRWGA